MIFRDQQKNPQLTDFKVGIQKIPVCQWFLDSKSPKNVNKSRNLQACLFFDIQTPGEEGGFWAQ